MTAFQIFDRTIREISKEVGGQPDDEEFGWLKKIFNAGLESAAQTSACTDGTHERCNYRIAERIRASKLEESTAARASNSKE